MIKGKYELTGQNLHKVNRLFLNTLKALNKGGGKTPVRDCLSEFNPAPVMDQNPRAAQKRAE